LASAFQNYLTDESPPLAVVSQPTLLIWGQSDRSHRKTNKLSTKQYAPQASEVWFELAGHFPELEEPELFVKHMREWARSLEQ
jgi:pimeloyl-ACP methyl ester carboxylesterase